MSDQSKEPVGSLAEEAAKLLSAVQHWAVENGDRYADAADGAAAQASAGTASSQEHVADGAGCTFCPLCRLTSRLRAVNPEVMTHLAASATSLSRALAALGTDGAGPGSRERSPRVEREEPSEEWPESGSDGDADLPRDS